MKKLTVGRIPLMKGEFVEGTTYEKLWQVTYLGSTYQSRIDDNTSAPAQEVDGIVEHINTDKWLCIADVTTSRNIVKDLQDQIGDIDSVLDNLLS